LTDTPQKKEDDSSKIIPVEDRTVERYRDMSYQSPWPHPEDLKAYDLTIPGGANRILQMGERQAQHRIDLEIKESQHKIDLEAKESQHKIDMDQGDQTRSWVGLLLGFLVACGFFYGAYDLVKLGHDIAGTALGGTTLATLVGIFVYGGNQKSKKSQSLEKQDKSD
jgi:uncharacterized membrane protein